MTKLGEVIREQRRKRGWTQGQLALYSGLGPEHISMIERGVRQNLMFDTIVKIATALEISVDWLTEEAGIGQNRNLCPGLPPEVQRVHEVIEAYPEGPAKEQAKELVINVGAILQSILDRLEEQESDVSKRIETNRLGPAPRP